MVQTEQYANLWDYCEELMNSNPGSTVNMKCNTTDGGVTKFERLYAYLDAWKKGFLGGCRLIVGVDDYFIKGFHKGKLLATVGIDPNNAIYPIAYATVESECYETWSWFFEFLKEDLGIVRTNQITWISDQQKGLIEAVKTVFGEAPHRFCLRHLYNNYKTQHKGLLLK